MGLIQQFRFRRFFGGMVCALGLLITGGCTDLFEHSKCKTVPVAETPSPDGKYQVVVANHFCKPQTAEVIARYVRLRRVNAKETDVGDTIFIITGKNEIRPIWIDATHLRIECPGLSPNMIESRHDDWNEVAISYSFNSP